MTEYLVRWSIHVDAANPFEAAANALAIQRDPAGIATVFEITQGDDEDNVTMIDVSEGQVVSG